MEKVAIRQFQKLSEKRIGSPMEDYYKQELENHKAALEKLQNPPQNDNGDWVLKKPQNEIGINSNTLKIKNLLEQNSELPSDILSYKDLIRYSFTSQINDVQATEEALRSVLKNDMQVVSIENTENNQFRLVALNENLELQQFDDKIYASEKDAMNAACSNNSIAKIISYQDILNSANHQSLEIVAGADNLKYPHVQILNFDNEIMENRLPLQDAEKLLSERAKANQENGITENAEINLFLNNINTYNFSIELGRSGSGIINHIKQYLNQARSEVSNNKSLQALQEYVQNNYPDMGGTENALHQQMKFADCFDFTSS